MAYPQDSRCEKILEAAYDLEARDGRGPNQRDLRRQTRLGSAGTIIKHLQHLVEDQFLHEEQMKDVGANHEVVYRVSELGTRAVTELVARQTGKAVVELNPRDVAHATWTMSEGGKSFSRPTRHPLVAYYKGKAIHGEIIIEEDWKALAGAALSQYRRTFGHPTLSPQEITEAVKELQAKGLKWPRGIPQVAPGLPLMPKMPSMPSIPSMPSMPSTIGHWVTIAQRNSPAISFPFSLTDRDRSPTTEAVTPIIQTVTDS